MSRGKARARPRSLRSTTVAPGVPLGETCSDTCGETRARPGYKTRGESQLHVPKLDDLA